MASGKFASSVYKGAGTGYYRYIEVVWTSKNNTTDNKSTITWKAYSRSPDPSTTYWVNAKNIVVTINGTPKTIVGSTETKLYKDEKLGEGSITVTHDSNGKKSVNVSITAQIYTYGETNSSYSGTIKMSPNPVYTLSISSGTGYSITVNRTTCAGSGGTGKLSAGTKKLYYGDKLKITFTPSSNYAIDTHKVNGATFTSGNTHTVSGNVTVAATATPLKSVIGATDANIGSNSTITIKRYNSKYTHTIKYKFGSKTGTIASESSDTSISWNIPTEFYSQIPDAKKGTCTLTCETFNGGTPIGSTTCSIVITVSADKCKPDITATVKDTNTITKALTGNDSTLIRYKSTALCTLKATPKNSATISSLSIAGSAVNGTTSDGVTTATKSFQSVSATSFKFIAKDSRGYNKEVTKTPTVIAYVKLSCNPVLSRPTPTGSSIVLTFTGDIFRGSFGACSNTLTLQYRYKKVGGSYGSWQTIKSSDIVFGTKSYRSNSSISVGNDFDYQNNYKFQIRATDGGVVNETAYTLSTVTKTLTVKRGIPVYDWGENDFAFNVPVNMPKNVYYDIDNKAGGGLHMNNSDISGCNAIVFSDTSDSEREGLNYARDNGNLDVLKLRNGRLYVIPNYPANTTAYSLYYTSGDKLTLSGLVAFHGYITTSSTELFFSIPLSRPVVAASDISVSGEITCRGVEGYLYNPNTSSTKLDLSNPSGFTITKTVKENSLYLRLTFTNKIQDANGGSYTNNTPISAVNSGDVVFTFS